MTMIPFNAPDGSEIFLSTDHVLYVKQHQDVVWVAMATPSTQGHPFVIYVQGTADEVRKRINANR